MGLQGKGCLINLAANTIEVLLVIIVIYVAPGESLGVVWGILSFGSAAITLSFLYLIYGANWDQISLDQCTPSDR